MPLTSHKRSVTKESPSGSAHSSPSRSPDPHGHHQAHQPTTHTTNPGDHPTGLTHSVGVEHSSSSASLTHSHAERDRHVPQERPSSSLSSGSNSSTGSGGGRSAVSMASSSHGHGRSVPPVWGEKVVLLVDGKRFTMNPKLFMSHPNTMLGRWVDTVQAEAVYRCQCTILYHTGPQTSLAVQGSVGGKNLTRKCLECWNAAIGVMREEHHFSQSTFEFY